MYRAVAELNSKIESLEALFDFDEQCADGFRVADVAAYCHRFVAYLYRCRFQRFWSAAGEHERKSRLRQGDGRRAADAAAGARDERDPPHEATVAIRPPSSSSI